jgi:hypothetical protein
MLPYRTIPNNEEPDLVSFILDYLSALNNQKKRPYFEIKSV